MARIIDADILKENCRITGEFMNNFECVSLKTLGEIIDKQPTIEAEAVKRGEWVIAKDKDGFAMWDACSSCGHGLHYVCEGKRFPYCPNCGAKMDGDSK